MLERRGDKIKLEGDSTGWGKRRKVRPPNRGSYSALCQNTQIGGKEVRQMCNYGAWLPYLSWDSFGPQVLISDYVWPAYSCKIMVLGGESDKSGGTMLDCMIKETDICQLKTSNLKLSNTWGNKLRTDSFEGGDPSDNQN